jgi:hypothetical protein
MNNISVTAMNNISTVDVINLIVSAITLLVGGILAVKYYNFKSSCCNGATTMETTLSNDPENLPQQTPMPPSPEKKTMTK